MAEAPPSPAALRRWTQRVGTAAASAPFAAAGQRAEQCAVCPTAALPRAGPRRTPPAAGDGAADVLHRLAAELLLDDAADPPPAPLRRPTSPQRHQQRQAEAAVRGSAVADSGAADPGRVSCEPSVPREEGRDYPSWVQQIDFSQDVDSIVAFVAAHVDRSEDGAEPAQVPGSAARPEAGAGAESCPPDLGFVLPAHGWQRAPFSAFDDIDVLLPPPPLAHRHARHAPVFDPAPPRDAAEASRSASVRSSGRQPSYQPSTPSRARASSASSRRVARPLTRLHACCKTTLPPLIFEAVSALHL
eukprot:TRINITY_DN28441_c0_g1_i1.p2 TRINITY_DN28441_c0_g1~~TRINITY_DN28441_c0_g1_i1.p2  ORF type:complete len:317 (+),score=109.45 TRINITY_DN28441_c0_g1_i1:46-951(+)